MAYINRELLIESLGKNSIIDKITYSDGMTIKEKIMKIPTADVVEVCRCKECANGYHKTDISVMCKIWNRLMITEDYCSYGAKMDGKECNK